MVSSPPHLLPCFSPPVPTLHRSFHLNSLQLAYPQASRPPFKCSTSAPPPSDNHPVSRRSFLSAISLLSLHYLSPRSARSEQQQEQNQQTSAPLTGFQTKSGIKYFDFARGEGPTPKWGDYVNIQYVIYTLTPEGDALVKQDSSYEYGQHGYLVHHGNGQLILGLEEMIHSMRAGGRRRAIIPATMGYATNVDLGPVPSWDRNRRKLAAALRKGDGTVVFDVEVRRIWDDPSTKEYYSDLTPTEDQIADYLNDRSTEL